ncbi:MAG: NAD-dependent epimerase/dehydratase family protein [Mongoliibacter sp.]|uniref:NAD-dependent epimerase/dehydratase family protein n=1 Tax=Mongoliibacter sp. TaxID=2022438 RepID=UPI0012F2ACBD|nr:NAD-dependent epimerase/dehydratase family protein [Mongoliibacter sp.]TVP52515.1 MAG: NAD-dependent epimerase/dehydratase family protein [Mongoliibacter sp.]
MKILFTGATGLLGSSLAKRFSAEAEIHGLKRESSNVALTTGLPIKWHTGDINDFQSLEEALEGMDMVVHAAALVSYNPKDEKELMRTNVEGAVNLVNAMLAKGIKKLVHISSVAALGKSPEADTIDETHKWVDSDLNTPYAISKYLGELEVWRGVQEGLEALVVHPSIILGKVGTGRSSTEIYDYVLEEKKYFPSGTVNYIDLRDTVEIIFQLYKKGVWNERVILSADSISYKLFFEKMALALGKKAPDTPVTDGMLRLGLFFIGLARKLGLTKSPLNKQTAMISQMSYHMDSSKVKDLLGYQFRSLEETFQWAKSND